MPQTSKEERARWAELCAKATPGPWHEMQPVKTPMALGLGCGIVADEPLRGRIDSSITGMREDDAKFIAAARTALPRLLADYDALERKVREFCVETDRVLILARQLVDGWYNTTPANEWSEFDESTRTEMRELHGKAVALRAAVEPK